MAYKLEVNHPDFPKDWEFDLDGIACKNGHSVTISEDEERAFVARVGRPIKDIYGHSKKNVKLSGTSELSTKEKTELVEEVNP